MGRKNVLSGDWSVADEVDYFETAPDNKHIRPEYLKRHLAWFRMDEVFRQDLSRFKDSEWRFFCKTNYKALSGITDDLVSFLGYATETMPPSTKVIISEVLDLLTDEKGKLEYRCFIVRGRVSSISRYIDYDTDYEIPPEITAFAEAFVTDHHALLPDCYVLDVGECARRGPVVIELNGIVASGRYEKNDFCKLLRDL